MSAAPPADDAETLPQAPSADGAAPPPPDGADATPSAAEIDELDARLRRPLPEIPTKYLYDDRGMALYDRITQLEAYYPARTEEAVLEVAADEIVARIPARCLAELGSGVSRKFRMLCDAMARADRLERCLFFDINEQALSLTARALEALYPRVAVRTVQGDFRYGLGRLGPGGDRLILFLAGTIGNLHPGFVPEFLRNVARQMAPEDGFLVGLGLVTDVADLERAYNDEEGVTARFNLNILRAVNRRFGTDFDREAFEHLAVFDTDEARIDVRVRATRATRVRLPSTGLELALDAGDTIRTELSCKYTRASFLAQLEGTGLDLDRWYEDDRGRHALALLRPTPA